ncbi:MAG: STAS-like domain-containing protein [Candidatus Hinthialibacter sp.]
MTDVIQINVYEIVGSEFCVASDDGQKVYDQISKILQNHKKVILSFRHVQSLTSAFLNSAIGQLYGRFSEDEIKKNLSVKDMDNDDLYLLKRVVDTAKDFFKDPQKFKDAVQEALEE